MSLSVIYGLCLFREGEIDTPAIREFLGCKHWTEDDKQFRRRWPDLEHSKDLVLGKDIEGSEHVNIGDV